LSYWKGETSGITFLHIFDKAVKIKCEL